VRETGRYNFNEAPRTFGGKEYDLVIPQAEVGSLTAEQLADIATAAFPCDVDMAFTRLDVRIPGVGEPTTLMILRLARYDPRLARRMLDGEVNRPARPAQAADPDTPDNVRLVELQRLQLQEKRERLERGRRLLARARDQVRTVEQLQQQNMAGEQQLQPARSAVYLLENYIRAADAEMEAFARYVSENEAELRAPSDAAETGGDDQTGN
jgi:hypothetical protein